MNHLGEFEGIGGFSLAAEMVGWETKAWVEINPFCQQILRYHFPKAQGFGDIKKFNYSVYKSVLRNHGIKDRAIDIITGGFPCQPYSQAGKRKGKEDDRHLWPEMLRTIIEFQPVYVVGENVHGIINWNGGLVFDEVQADLEAAGYEVFAYVLPACSVNAPHRRDRVWFVAYSERNRNIREERRINAEAKGMEIKWRSQNDSTGKSSGTNQHDNEGCRKVKHGITTDSANARAEGMRQERQNTVHGSKHAPNSHISGFQEDESKQSTARIEQYGKLGTHFNSNPDDKGLQGLQFNGAFNEGEFGRQSRESTPELHQITNWKEFPTQSPVCGRDDGLPVKLDGITFSKWRQESIKAYGNAIVPQVVLQIFKSINEYENAK